MRIGPRRVRNRIISVLMRRMGTMMIMRRKIENSRGGEGGKIKILKCMRCRFRGLMRHY